MFSCFKCETWPKSGGIYLDIKTKVETVDSVDSKETVDSVDFVENVDFMENKGKTPSMVPLSRGYYAGI